MTVTVNGRAHDVGAGATLLDLLRQLGLPTERLALERNRQVVPRREWQVTPVADGDRIEIVHFVGGGAEFDTLRSRAR